MQDVRNPVATWLRLRRHKKSDPFRAAFKVEKSTRNIWVQSVIEHELLRVQDRPENIIENQLNLGFVFLDGVHL